MSIKKNKKNRTIIYTLLTVLTIGMLGVGVAAYSMLTNRNQEPASDTGVEIVLSPSPQTATTEPSSEREVAAPQPTATPLPEKVYIDVPFLVQAPFGNWDSLHNEACEEASLIMMKHFLDKTSITPESGEEEILDMVSFEEQHGYEVDITVAEVAAIAKSYYDLPNGRVETNISIEAIKRELASGRPVIVPAAGRLLPNPYFSGEGPRYHMLVIKGYDAQGFITNDPGTRRGKDFRYSYNDLLYAIHDWNPSDILLGQKAYLVFD